MSFDSDFFKRFFNKYIQVIEDNKDYLSDLDRKAGDGDHGITMSIGWQAVKKELEGPLYDEKDPAKINIVVGKTFLNATGSSVGPLYATGFLRGAKVLKDSSNFNEKTLVSYWESFCNGIKERGGAEIGDKTMIDTLEPAKNKLIEQFEITNDLIVSFAKALIEAKKGMESTINMISKKGRSSRLGDRSRGGQDPGATSAYLLLKSFMDSLEVYII